MFDSLLLFSNAQVFAASGFSTNALDLRKTKGDGVWVEVVVSALGAGTSLVITAYTKDVDAAWAVTDRVAGITQAPIVATGRYGFRMQTKNRYAKLNFVFTGGATTATLTAGIVSGPQQDFMV